jgi:hypothetical protein
VTHRLRGRAAPSGESERVTNIEMNVPPSSENGARVASAANNVVLQRSLIGVAIAAVSAAVTFFLVRNAMRRAPVDETSERIQSLIDEANRLLRTLDEKKHG